MGLNFFRSINLGGGVRLNLSKKGLGVSTGVPGFRVGVGPRGTRVRATLPGTGIYYQKYIGKNRKRDGKVSSTQVDNEDANFIAEPAIDSSFKDSKSREEIIDELRENIITDAISLLRVNHFQESLSKFQSALKITKNSADILFFIGLIDFKLGHPHRAIRNLLKALDYVDFLGTDIPVGKLKFKATLKTSKSSVIPLEFDHKSVILLLAKSLEETGQIRRSITLLREYFKHNPSDEIVLFALMDSLIEQKEFLEAIKEYEANQLAQVPIKKACALLAIRALVAVGDLDKAKQIESEIKSATDVSTQSVQKTNHAVTANDIKAGSEQNSNVDISNPQDEKSIKPDISGSKPAVQQGENDLGKLFLLTGLFIVNSKVPVIQEDVRYLVENPNFHPLYGMISKADILHCLREYTEKEEHKRIGEHVSTSVVDDQTRKRLFSYAVDVALRDFVITQEELKALEYLARLLEVDKKYLPGFMDQARIEYFKKNWHELSITKKPWLVEELNKMGLHAKNIGLLFGMTSREIRGMKNTRPLKRMSEEEQQRVVNYLFPNINSIEKET